MGVTPPQRLILNETPDPRALPDPPLADYVPSGEGYVTCRVCGCLVNPAFFELHTERHVEQDEQAATVDKLAGNQRTLAEALGLEVEPSAEEPEA